MQHAFVTFQSDHTHFLKRVVLFKKQHFRIFELSNISNENKQVDKNHFIFCKTDLSISLSKI